MTLPGFFPVLPLALAAASGVAIRATEIGSPRIARALGGGALGAQFALAALAVSGAARPLAFQYAPWPARAGLVLALDPLAAGMLLASALCALLAFAASPGAAGRAGSRCGSWLQFQLLALDGIFLVSDLGSLYVCFAASWLLACRAVMRHGEALDSRPALLGGASALAIAIGCIAAAVGTLDFAGLALAAPAVPTADASLPTAGAFVLLAVFALAATAAPLVLVRPAAAERAAAGVLVLVAPLAASAVYAIIRLYTLAFPCFLAGPCGPSGLALPLGLSIVTGAALASLTARRARGLIACLMLLSLGLALVAAGGMRVASLAAGIYLLLHATLGGAALLLTLEFVARATSGGGANRAAVLYGLALATMVGLPPLSGFLGSVALLRASGSDALAVWTLVLSSMLVGLIAIVRAWRAAATPELAAGEIASSAEFAAAAAIAVLLALGIAAQPVLEFSSAAARQLLDRAAYVAAVAAAR